MEERTGELGGLVLVEDRVVLLENGVVFLNLNCWLVVGLLDVLLDKVFLVTLEPMVSGYSVSDDSVELLILDVTDDVDKIES